MCENQINSANIKEIKPDILQMVIDFSYSGEILMSQVSFKLSCNGWSTSFLLII